MPSDRLPDPGLAYKKDLTDPLSTEVDFPPVKQRTKTPTHHGTKNSQGAGDPSPTSAGSPGRIKRTQRGSASGPGGTYLTAIPTEGVAAVGGGIGGLKEEIRDRAR